MAAVVNVNRYISTFYKKCTSTYSQYMQLTCCVILLQISYTSNLKSTQRINSTKTNIVLTKLIAGVQYSIIVSTVTNSRIFYSNTVTVFTCKLI